jgi:hypothetical protein
MRPQSSAFTAPLITQLESKMPRSLTRRVGGDGGGTGAAKVEGGALGCSHTPCSHLECGVRCSNVKPRSSWLYPPRLCSRDRVPVECWPGVDALAERMSPRAPSLYKVSCMPSMRNEGFLVETCSGNRTVSVASKLGNLPPPGLHRIGCSKSVHCGRESNP